jgi:hypothetical protein
VEACDAPRGELQRIIKEKRGRKIKEKSERKKKEGGETYLSEADGVDAWEGDVGELRTHVLMARRER